MNLSNNRKRTTFNNEKNIYSSSRLDNVVFDKHSVKLLSLRNISVCRPLPGPVHWIMVKRLNLCIFLMLCHQARHLSLSTVQLIYITQYTTNEFEYICSVLYMGIEGGVGGKVYFFPKIPIP